MIVLIERVEVTSQPILQDECRDEVCVPFGWAEAKTRRCLEKSMNMGMNMMEQGGL